MIRGVDDDLKKEFKSATASNGETMNGALIDLLKYYIISTKNLSNDKGSNSDNYQSI